MLIKRSLRDIGTVLCVAGCVVAVWPAGQTVYGIWSQRSLQAQYASSASSPEAAKAVPVSAPMPSAPAAKPERWRPTRLLIPAIDLDVVVVDAIDASSLQRGPGHDPATALPGQPGNCIIAGHRNVCGSWFYRLDELTPGTAIEVRTHRRSSTYRVISVSTVSDSDITVMRPPDGTGREPWLTLITCTLPHTPNRIVVSAQMEAKARAEG